VRTSKPRPPPGRPPPADSAVNIAIGFTEKGSVGLNLKETSQGSTVWVTVQSIVPGSQATRHPGIREGLRVVGVGGEDARGKSFDEVVDLIIDHPSRPIEFCFLPPLPEALPAGKPPAPPPGRPLDKSAPATVCITHPDDGVLDCCCEIHVHVNADAMLAGSGSVH
jgi:hypothetical protein